MKWESSDLTVGVVVIGAVLILTSAILWKSPAVAGRTYPLYTEFERIDGIDKQASVILRGYTIGRVGAIEPRLDATGLPVFRVRMDIRSHFGAGDSLRLPEGTRARLMPPPVIGAGVIVLEPPAAGGGPIEPGGTIPGTRAAAVLDQVQTLATDLSTELLNTMATTRVLLDTLTRAVSAANRTVAIVNREVPVLLGGLQNQLAAAGKLTEEMRGHMGTLAPAAMASIDSAQLLLSGSRKLLQDVNRLLVEGEPEMTGILANLDSTTVLLHHFVREVSERPWKLLTGVEPPAGLRPPAAKPASTAETRPGHRP